MGVANFVRLITQNTCKSFCRIKQF